MLNRNIVMLKAGFHELDITPTAGTERAGGFTKYLFTNKVISPLKVNAAVFDNGTAVIALIGIDVCYIDARACNLAKEKIFQAVGIKPENIMIAASHTHSGPVVAPPVDAEIIKNLSPETRQLLLETSPMPSPGYAESCVEQIAMATIKAFEKREEVLLNSGNGHWNSYVFNRRFRMKNGRIVTHPGQGNPDIVAPAGPIDPCVGVLGVWRPGADLPMGCVINFTCHATVVGGRDISADWVHYTRETVRKMMGNDCLTIFLNGASGDITQVDNRSFAPTQGIELARKLGAGVGAETVSTLYATYPGEFSEVESRFKNLMIPCRSPNPDKGRKAREFLAANPDDKSSIQFIFARDRVIYEEVYKLSPLMEVPIQSIKIGDSLFVANPAELFCQLGLDIKTSSPFHDRTRIVELANSHVAYVPTPDSFSAEGGGYETLLSPLCSFLAPDAGITIVKESLSMIADMKPELIPGLTGTPGKSWKLGQIGPDLD